MLFPCTQWWHKYLKELFFDPRTPESDLFWCYKSMTSFILSKRNFSLLHVLAYLLCGIGVKISEGHAVILVMCKC